MSYKEDRKKDIDPDSILNLPRKKRGRPPKVDIEAKKNRGKVGRPAGDAAIMNEYKARLLASPKSKKVLDTILDAALDNEHKNQAAAWKLLVDRLMPLSSFDRDAQGGKPIVEITIRGLDASVNTPNIIEGVIEETSQGDIIDIDS